MSVAVAQPILEVLQLTGINTPALDHCLAICPAYVQFELTKRAGGTLAWFEVVGSIKMLCKASEHCSELAERISESMAIPNYSAGVVRLRRCEGVEVVQE
jgi:hypothetical protein